MNAKLSAPVVHAPAMSVGGVDYGGRRASFCVLDPDGTVRSWNLRMEKTYDNFDPRLYDEYWHVIRGATEVPLRGVGYWCVESPIVGNSKNAQTAVKMAMTAGALLAGVGDLARVDLVPPATWKKEIVGRGNADKAEVAEYVALNHAGIHNAAVRHGTKTRPNQDIIDAGCLALCAQARMAG